MKKSLCSALLLYMLCASSALAEKQKVERVVGTDGVPVIRIKGEAPPANQSYEDDYEEPTRARKAFKVYQLEGDQEEAQAQNKVIVISSPPPVAPNPGAYNGYGYGYPYNPYGQFYRSGNFYSPGNFFGPGIPVRRAYRGTQFNSVNSFQVRSNFRGFNTVPYQGNYRVTNRVRGRSRGRCRY